MYCLIVSGVPLSAQMNTLLLETASRLANGNMRAMRVRCDGAEGEVATELKHVTLGGASGIEFSADLDTELGSTKVRFLVENSRLRNPPTRVNWLMYTEAGWIPMDDASFN